MDKSIVSPFLTHGVYTIYDRLYLLLPTTDTVTVGRRGFYYAGSATWNSMSMSLFSFRKLLFH